MSEHYDGWRDALREITERGVSEGAFVCDDPRSFAIETAAMVDGLAVQCYSRGSSLPVETSRNQLISFVKRELKIG